MRGAAVAYFLGCAFGAAYWLADDKLIVRRVVDESTARNFIGESAKWRNDVPDQLMPVEGAVCLRREGDQLWIDVLVPPLSWLSVATLQFCRDTLEKENITAESVVAAEPVYFSQFQLPQHERDALRAAGALIALFYASACVILSLGHGVLLAATWRRLFPSVPLLRFRPHGDVENGTDATLVAPRSSGDAATKVS